MTFWLQKHIWNSWFILELYEFVLYGHKIKNLKPMQKSCV